MVERSEQSLVFVMMVEESLCHDPDGVYHGIPRISNIDSVLDALTMKLLLVGDLRNRGDLSLIIVCFGK